MEIWLIRHTTPKVAKGVAYGQTDLEVSDDYEAQKMRIANHLEGDFQEATIYASPLQRCRLLAEDLAAPFNKNIQLDDRIKEVNFGVWEMVPWGEIPPETLNPWMNDFVNFRVPEGESFLDLQERVISFWEELLAQHSNDDKIMISTHSGVIRTLLCYVLEIPLKNAFRLDLHYGTISKITHKNNLTKVVYFNH
ncbi:alpha-ribazole phosphatase [marine bacterium AO1-C]|nr:alpha-ribazole phosphatase [marine bacterium AO1-C]